MAAEDSKPEAVDTNMLRRMMVRHQKKDHRIKRMILSLLVRMIGTGLFVIDLFFVFLLFFRHEKVKEVISVKGTKKQVLYALLGYDGILWERQIEAFREKFVNADVNCHLSPIGKDALVKNVVDTMFTLTKRCNSWNPEDKVSKFPPGAFGFMLHGPPGTGKTMTAKYAAYKLDMKLREEEYRRERGVKGPVPESALEDMQSRVKFCSISVNDFEGTRQGQRERAIRALVHVSEEMVRNTNLRAVVIFFDEAEKIFLRRSLYRLIDRGFGFAAELLESVGQVPDDGMYLPIFILAASRKPEKLDRGFVRRIGTWKELVYPNDKERRELILDRLNNYRDSIDKDLLDVMVAESKGKSHAIIIAAVDNAKQVDISHRVTGLDKKKFTDMLLREQATNPKSTGGSYL